MKPKIVLVKTDRIVNRYEIQRTGISRPRSCQCNRLSRHRASARPIASSVLGVRSADTSARAHRSSMIPRLADCLMRDRTVAVKFGSSAEHRSKLSWLLCGRNAKISMRRFWDFFFDKFSVAFICAKILSTSVVTDLTLIKRTRFLSLIQTVSRDRGVYQVYDLWWF